jgi:hypothetical protein
MGSMVLVTSGQVMVLEKGKQSLAGKADAIAAATTGALLAGLATGPLAAGGENIMRLQQKHKASAVTIVRGTIRKHGGAFPAFVVLTRGRVAAGLRDGVNVVTYGVAPEIVAKECGISPVIASALSALAGVISNHPLDCIKTEQMKAEDPQNMVRTAQKMWRKDGARAFRSGIGWRTLNVGCGLFVLSELNRHLTDYVYAQSIADTTGVKE